MCSSLEAEGFLSLFLALNLEMTSDLLCRLAGRTCLPVELMDRQKTVNEIECKLMHGLLKFFLSSCVGFR